MRLLLLLEYLLLLLLLVRQMETPVTSMKVGSTSYVPQATVEFAGHGSVVWPDSLSEKLIEGAGLQQLLCCLIASTARALLCMADAEFGIQVWCMIRGLGTSFEICGMIDSTQSFPTNTLLRSSCRNCMVTAVAGRAIQR